MRHNICETSPICGRLRKLKLKAKYAGKSRLFAFYSNRPECGASLFPSLIGNALLFLLLRSCGSVRDREPHARSASETHTGHGVRNSKGAIDFAPGRVANHFTTKFTIRPGTTTVLTISFPASWPRTVSSSSAIRCIAALSAPTGTRIFARTFPLT